MFYDKRPSVWIEPIGQWGTGSVQLVEIANLDETFDNIVAFWNPAEPVKAGQELLFSYNMYWGTNPPVQTKLAKVVDTFTGLGGVVGLKRKYYSQRFAVDFTGGDLGMIGKDTEIKPVLSTSAGRIEITGPAPARHKRLPLHVRRGAAGRHPEPHQPAPVPGSQRPPRAKPGSTSGPHRPRTTANCTIRDTWSSSPATNKQKGGSNSALFHCTCSTRPVCTSTRRRLAALASCLSEPRNDEVQSGDNIRAIARQVADGLAQRVAVHTGQLLGQTT